MKLPALLIWTCILCTGCVRADQPEGTVADATVDSAGVEIITNSRRSLGDVPRLDAVEELRIGSADGPVETQFASVRNVIEADDGTVWLYDVGNARISVFSADGAFLRSFGRRGSGPGEFGESIMGMTLIGDTLLFLEIDRVHAFDRTGTLLHTRITRTGRIRQFVLLPSRRRPE